MADEVQVEIRWRCPSGYVHRTIKAGVLEAEVRFVASLDSSKAPSDKFEFRAVGAPTYQVISLSDFR